MTQQLSPWLEGAYGWDFGEGGWNSGMDQNLLKFSFMFDRNVDSIVSSLPPALNGQAHYLTTDNRIYFVVNNTYYSSPVPKWFEFKVKSTGQTYQFNGTSAVVINSPADIDTRLDAVELTVSSLGSAAFEDVGAFATSTELDLVEAQAQSYTDTYKTDVANSADISKGAALIGYAGTTVRNTLVSHGATITDNSSNISRLNAVQSNNAPLYFKSKVLEVGFRDATYDSLVATYGYDYLYPQSFAIDTAANELWVLRAANTGANNWPWIWVYDLTTGVRKTTFTTGQQWRETLIIRYAGTFGTDRYVYTIGNSNSVIRMLLNTLPANLSTATIANTYAVDAQSQMAWDGTNWYVQDSKALQGLSARNRFTIRNPSMALQTGQVTLPFDTLGTLQAYTDSFPKSQGICFHQGSIYVANGGPYDPANPAHVAANNNGIYLQGIQSVSPQGEKERTALSHPADYIANMSTLLGYTATVCETEGVYSAGGNLYSLQITLGPTDRVNPVNAGKGVVIIKELSTDANRVSFLSGARALPTPFNPLDFQARCWHSSGQLTNPVTGAAITTFSGIVAMMRELGLSTYLFGQTRSSRT